VIQEDSPDDVSLSSSCLELQPNLYRLEFDMRKLVFSLLFVVSASVFLSAGSAYGDAREEHDYYLADDRYDGVLTGQAIRQGKVQGDTIYLMGGPDRDDGDFETAEGEPDWEGWISIDLTVETGSIWHCADYHCQNLDPTTVPNHAWWCGTMYNFDCGTGDFGGYGNLWVEWLDWHGAVADNTLPTTVTVHALLNYDVEPGYDYLYFGHETVAEMVQDQIFNGAMDSVVVDLSFAMTPADYVGADLDKVHLRWWFHSDGGWSDEDCFWPTFGAAQVDLIDVYFDQGDGPVQQGITEECEGGPNQWVNAPTPGVGDFAHIWSGLQDIDPCRSNSSCVVAFIDDGIVEPGTGG
jgi:hypothetical protein